MPYGIARTGKVASLSEPRFEFVALDERAVVLRYEFVQDSLESSLYLWGDSVQVAGDDEVRDVETDVVEVVCAEVARWLCRV